MPWFDHVLWMYKAPTNLDSMFYDHYWITVVILGPFWAFSSQQKRLWCFYLFLSLLFWGLLKATFSNATRSYVLGTTPGDVHYCWFTATLSNTVLFGSVVLGGYQDHTWWEWGLKKAGETWMKVICTLPHPKTDSDLNSPLLSHFMTLFANQFSFRANYHFINFLWLPKQTGENYMT